MNEKDLKDQIGLLRLGLEEVYGCIDINKPKSLWSSDKKRLEDALKTIEKYLDIHNNMIDFKELCNVRNEAFRKFNL